MNEQNVRPKIWQIIFIGIIAIIFTAVWLSSYELLNEVVWMNEFIKANRWTILVLPIVFAILVGLCGKYLNAPNVIKGGIADSVNGEESENDYRIFPGTLLSSFLSLLSGASIGPEGPLGFLVLEISSYFREKLKIRKEAALGFDTAALASAYNGIIGSPLFTAILATEFNIGKKDAMTFIAWNLLAGVLGYLFYSFLGLKSFASMLAFPPITEISTLYVIIAVIMGILGAFMAVFMGLLMKGVGNVMDRVFADRKMARILCAGVITAVVCYLVPDLMFSGESQLGSIIANPAEFGIILLLIMAVLKVFLLAVSLKSGFLGGPIFPILFTCTMVGLAFSLLFPGIPVGIFVMCLEVAVMTLSLGVPLTAILLVAVLGAGFEYYMGLLVLSSVVAMLIGVMLKELQEKRKTINHG